MGMIRKGNRKLPKTTGIFNLPHLVTCPGATADCKAYCYARKAEVQYKQVLPYRYTNLALSKAKDFVANMVAEITRLKLRTIRIHESGDFYNQAYVNKWTAIAKALPSVRFTFYTKSFHLFDFTKLRALPNVTAFASIDPTTPIERLYPARDWDKATVICKGAEAPKGFFVCPGSCKECSHCYKAHATSVAFHQH